MRIRSRKSLWVGLSMLLGAFAAGNASAGPLLQLYIEGATYDSANEGWYYPGHQFRLWAIADLSGPGGAGAPITEVRLAAVYDGSVDTEITITPVLIGGQYSAFNDSTLPDTPTLLQTVTDGSRPVIGGTHRLPGHGEYGPGRTWQEFQLSDFDDADSQMPDFVNGFPVPGTGLTAQIHAYDVSVNGADAHFDLYGLIESARGHIYVFAPPSHDATDGPEAAAVPLPATLALLGIGTLGLGICRRRKAVA